MLSEILTHVAWLSILLLAQAASDQSDSRLSGTVVDSEGAAIGNALVIVHWDGSGSRTGLEDNRRIKEDIRARTDKEGRVNLDLPPGFYDVFVASTAFSPTCLKVRVKTGKPATFKVQLKFDPLVCKETCDTFN
jgi:Carboxypeptidase regulatory-like domain